MDTVPYLQPKETLRVLFVEDDEDDLGLILRELKKADLRVEALVAQTKADFMAHLAGGRLDVVIADYQLGGWTGIDALQTMRALQNTTPFILVTGALGDELAVDCVQEGISDYVLKDRLARLPVAIRRAVKDVAVGKQHQEAVDKVRDTENLFRTLAEAIDSAIFVYTGSKCIYANSEAETITGFNREELFAMSSLEIVEPESRQYVIEMGFRGMGIDDSARAREVKIRTKSGASRWLNMTSRTIEIGGRLSRLVTAHDVTEIRAADEEMRRLAATDPLTGLANYRRLMGTFEAECSRSQRTGRAFSLMLLDLDHLKKINDIHGHSIGSRAICRVGQILQTQCRSVDLAARYGGDEFVLILPETGASAARNVARRIVGAVRRDPEAPQISVSFGLATCPDHGRTFKEVLGVADRGMYSMKGERDRPSPCLDPEILVS